MPAVPETPLASRGALGVSQVDWRHARPHVDPLRRACFLGAGGADDPLDHRARHIVAEAVVDGRPQALGACRLFLVERRADIAATASAKSYGVEALLERRPNLRLAELSRFCIAKTAGSRTALEAIWRALWQVVRAERIELIFGCASLPGADFARHADALAHLCDPTRGDPLWRVRARHPEAAHFPGAVGAPRPRLPALLRGYAELGATFSPEATLDPDFDTVDVFVAQPVAALNARYVAHFS